MVSATMMIPGEWEPRRSSKPASVVAPVEAVPSERFASLPLVGGRSAEASEPRAERPELPAWLKVSIFAATLMAATWLAMAARAAVIN